MPHEFRGLTGVLKFCQVVRSVAVTQTILRPRAEVGRFSKRPKFPFMVNDDLSLPARWPTARYGIRSPGYTVTIDGLPFPAINGVCTFCWAGFSKCITSAMLKMRGGSSLSVFSTLIPLHGFSVM